MKLEFEFASGSLELEETPSFNVNSETPLSAVAADQAKSAGSLAVVSGSINGKEGNSSFEFSTGLEIEVINKNNPHYGEVPQSDGDGDVSVPIYPWSFGGALPAAVAYKLYANIGGIYRSGEFPIRSGATASFGLEGDSRMEAVYIVKHKESDRIGDCAALDLAGHGFLFPRSPDSVRALRPGIEFLLNRYQGGFAFEANLTWGQMFRSDPGLLRSVFGDTTPIGVKNAADEEVIELGISAGAGLGVRFEAGLELVASVFEEGGKRFARLAFRRASRSSTTANVSFTAKANIPDAAGSLKALAQLIALRADVGSPLDHIEDALRNARSKVEAFRNLAPAELATKFLVGWSDAQIASGKQIAAEWLAKLNASANDWLGVQHRLAKIESAIQEISADLGLNEQIATVLDDLLSRATALDDLRMSAESQDLLKTVLDRLPEHTALSLASFLGVSHFRESVGGAVPGAGVTGALESLRAQILQAADFTGIATEAEQKVSDLFSQVEKQTGFTLSSLLADLESRKLLQGMVPVGSAVSADQFLKKIADEMDASLADVEQVVKWFGGKTLELPERIDDALSRLTRAIPKELEISAGVEFESIKENETLLSLDYDLTDSGFDSMYRNLVSGNWRDVLDRYHPETPGPFRQLDFYAIEQATKRKSFRLRVFRADFSQEAIDTSSRVEDIMGRSRYEFSSEGRWHVDYTDRDWKGYSRLTATGTEFFKEGDVRGSGFDFRYDSGIFCSGRVNPRGNENTTARENWELFKFLSIVFDGKTNLGQSVFHLGKDWVSDEPKDLQLELNFSIAPSRFKKIWKIAPKPKNGLSFNSGDSRLVEFFLAVWPSLKKARYTKIGDENARGLTDPEERNFNAYFEQFGELAERVSDTGKARSLFRQMKQWRFCTNRTGSADDKLDKICYPISMLAHMPENGSGWTASAVLTLGEQRYYFG